MGSGVEMQMGVGVPAVKGMTLEEEDALHLCVLHYDEANQPLELITMMTIG